ncbi:MAG: J domain-containing protein [Alphaproteobacteria bacterium]
MCSYFDNFSDKKPDKRCCDAEGCTEEGSYRAPRSREDLSSYYWFCLQHVQAYNRQWDYCAGMSAVELEIMIRQSVLGERPTWSPAMHQHMDRLLRRKAEAFRWAKEEETGDMPAPPMKPELHAALRILGFNAHVSLSEVRKRYLDMVKELHPDLNQADPVKEDKLKKINRAYDLLKKELEIADF